MEEAFSKVVQRIFSNWTALRLAVEHNMSGTNSLQIAIDISSYMTKYCICDLRADPENIQDTIEDIMDEEFDVICDDGSPKEISCILYKFVHLLRENNTTDFETEFNKLPPLQEWLVKPELNRVAVQAPSESSEDEEEESAETSMEVTEPEWTQVRSRRRK